jgi:anaerobic selenocysteine-containing dehydrogenase
MYMMGEYLEKDGTYTNTDRRVQLGHKALDAPGDARPDWEITQEIANRLYTDAKRIHDARVITVAGLAAVTIVVAVAVPDARTLIGTIGGAITFLWSLLGGGREKRCRKQAAFIQEEFDTHVFAMPWNTMAADHPSPTVIATAAARYRGNRTRTGTPTPTLSHTPSTC